ncbi:MAG TPA: hypothetical protein VM053_07890 [Gemmatimonadaceae bacterium]|nr:hypothetical protein [Gemmatimonadaceae bacterium]
MRKVWTLGVALASLVVLSGCNAIDAISSGRITGTYELRTVNGAQPPALIYQEPGYYEEVLSATISLENDGSYSEAGIIRETINGRSTTSSTSSYGYYDEYNGDITFTTQAGRTFYGTATNGRLVIQDQGLTMTYLRY